MSSSSETLAGDDRGVTAVIGFILIFGILVISFTIYQAHVVPHQNSEVEFEHYQEIREDMHQLRTAHVNAVESGQQRSASLALGTLYPSRTVAVNPPPPEGTLRTESLGKIQLAVDGDQVDLGTACGATPETAALQYETQYHELSEREAFPIVYENTVIYRTPSGDGAPLVDTDQLLIEGTTLNLLPLQAEVSESGLTTSVEFASSSYGPAERLNESGTVTLTLPTLEPELWRDELLTGVDTVTQVTAGDGEVNITLQNPPETGEEWTVRCAIATNDDDVPETDPPSKEDGDEDGDAVGVGLGAVSEFDRAENRETFSTANGKWLDIDSIDGIELFNGEPARLTGSQGSNFQGDVVQLTFELRDGASDRQVTADVQLERDPDGGGFNTRTVEFTDDNGNNQNLDLTPEAAEAIYGDGVVDILDEQSYDGQFDFDDGSFGSFVETIRRMENAEWQTSEVTGRTDVRIVPGDLLLTLADGDRDQVVEKGGTVEFNATVENLGSAERTQNVDLVIRQSGQVIDSESPRADRETVTLSAGETGTVDLTWSLDDNVDTGTYEAIVETDDDMARTSVYVADDESVLEVTIDNLTSPVERGDPFRLNATITNNGPGKNDPRDVTLELDDDGSDIASDTVQGVELAEGESTSVTFDGIDTLEDIGTDSTGEMTATVGGGQSNTISDETTAIIRNAEVVTNASADDVEGGKPTQNQDFAFTLAADLQGGDEIAIDLGDTGSDLAYSTDESDWQVRASSDASGTVSEVAVNNGQVQRVIYEVGPDDTAGDKIAIRDRVDASSAQAGTSYNVSVWVKSANDFAEGPQNGDRSNTEFDVT